MVTNLVLTSLFLSLSLSLCVCSLSVLEAAYDVFQHISTFAHRQASQLQLQEKQMPQAVSYLLRKYINSSEM
jgi:hypothetical protein